MNPTEKDYFYSAPQDRYRLPTIPEIDDNEKPLEIQGAIYDKAKAIFIENKGAISTRELKKTLQITYEQSVAIMDLLKLDIKPETLIAWNAATHTVKKK